jgi:hypothetical protein
MMERNQMPWDTDQVESYIAAAAPILALPLELEWKPAILANLEVTLKMAALVGAFPLPDDAEPSPVFEA